MSGISTSSIDFIPRAACANSQGICGFSYCTAEESGSSGVTAKVGPDLGSVRHVSRGPPFAPVSTSDWGGGVVEREAQGQVRGTRRGRGSSPGQLFP